MNPQDNVQKPTTTNPQTTYPNNPPCDPIQQGLGSNVSQTQFPQPPMGYAPAPGMPQHSVPYGMHPGILQGQYGPAPGPPTAPGVHYSYPVQHNYTPMPGAVGTVPPQGGYPQNMYPQAPYQQPLVPPPVSGAVTAQGSFPQNVPPQQSNIAAPPPPVYYGPPPQHYAHAYTAYYPPPGHYPPYHPTQFTQTMGSVETSAYPPPETTQSAESVNKAPSVDVEVEQNTIQEHQALQQQVPNPSLTPQVNQPTEQLLSHPLPLPSASEDAPIVDKREVENTELVQEMNNVTLEEPPSLPVTSSSTTQETERPVSQTNPEENSLLKVFVTDLTNRLMKLSKEDQTEVIQNALSRLGLHECIDALVEEFGMKDVTEATTGANPSNF